MSVDGNDMAVREFLGQVVLLVESGSAGEAVPAALRPARVFLEAGLCAVRSQPLPWIQYDLTIVEERRRELYVSLLEFVSGGLPGGMANFFLMHKPPGIRLRFEATPGGRTRESVDEWLQAVQAAGCVLEARNAVYEPEHVLFGGHESMPSVHRIFTLDSLVWLAYHAQATTGPVPAWRLSLRMIRSLLDGLGIDDLEDLGLWDHLVRDAGRGFRREPPGNWHKVADEIRRAWYDTSDKVGREADLADVSALLSDYERRLPHACEQWTDTYFRSPDARIGRVAAAVPLVAFHWNRARLSPAWQIALSEALRMGPGEIRSDDPVRLRNSGDES
ncbi:thiopeptide-type bacteriocin biosynthesis protein [Streptomyces sp. 378]|uniref:thiopeptide-type bacteriocin biosynthesis protein n=1 Tax=Streptomyces sp. 378 TaxID=3049412 RepID=UPI0024C25777|nr:thiopeptide-type bacteriocin biosynthesis protein [Streptomyces sp. 378]MDK1349089.1 thiopeptide-type bacteriocin biosynthesis protein [Streptomyces sp. 378]